MFIWNEYSGKKIGIARIYGPGTNFLTGGTYNMYIFEHFKHIKSH